MSKPAPAKRKSISKKLRFEVFKRDSFTCQYCGRKAPDVVLHIDHIKPVAGGGKNSIMNLVTSCMECNLGKGARTLDDSSTVEKSRKQAEVLQERREQIKMLSEWHLQLAEQQEEEVNAVCDLFKVLSGNKRIVNDTGKEQLRPLIAKYGLGEVMTALREATSGYGEPSKALDKLAGVLACRQHPHLRRRAYITTILRRRFVNYEHTRCVAALDRGYAAGGEEFFDKVEDWAKFADAGSWSRSIGELEAAIPQWEKRKNG